MSGIVRREAPVIVVGGGVVGLAIAYELGCRGIRAVVLERDEPGAGATRASAGMLAPVSEAETEESDRIRLACDSKQRYPDFIRGLEERSGVSCRYRTEGTLWVGINHDEERTLGHLQETLRRKGFHAEWLESRQVLEREPGLSSRVAGGLFVAEDHQVDPRSLTHALVNALTRLGGEVESGITVTEIVASGGRVECVRARSGGGTRYEYRAPVVVLAAGAWSTTGIRSPVAHIGVRPVKGQMVRLREARHATGAGTGTTGRMLRHVIRTPEVYLVPREDGTLLVGTTVEEQGFFMEPTAGGVLDILRHGWLVFPGLYDMALVEVSTGFRPAVRDHFPVLGPTGTSGLYIATGHFRGGILLAPATAQYMCDLILEGRTPPEIAPFGIERLSSRTEVAS